MINDVSCSFGYDYQNGKITINAESNKCLLVNYSEEYIPIYLDDFKHNRIHETDIINIKFIANQLIKRIRNECKNKVSDNEKLLVDFLAKSTMNEDDIKFLIDNKTKVIDLLSHIFIFRKTEYYK